MVSAFNIDSQSQHWPKIPTVLWSEMHHTLILTHYLFLVLSHRSNVIYFFVKQYGVMHHFYSSSAENRWKQLGDIRSLKQADGFQWNLTLNEIQDASLSFLKGHGGIYCNASLPIHDVSLLKSIDLIKTGLEPETREHAEAHQVSWFIYRIC